MRLKELREQAGLSQYRLAKISGVNQSHISKLERAERGTAGGAILLKLSRAIGCTIEELLGDGESKTA